MRAAAAVLLGWMFFALAGCDSGSAEYREVEVGYKGRARLNPWLAAERFAGRYGHEVESLTAWRAPSEDDAAWFVPASILNNDTFVRKVEEWAAQGGHLVVLVEHAGAETSDWHDFDPEVEVEQCLKDMLKRSGIQLTKVDQFKEGAVKPPEEIQLVELKGQKYEVCVKSASRVEIAAGAPGEFCSVRTGRGRISVLADARPLRNRWIGEHQHPEFLGGLLDASDYGGKVVFVRGSRMSFWGMVRRHLWPVLLGLLAVVTVWLWRNMSRFGPLEAAEARAVVRGYDHHLEALGNFHWRFNRAALLLDSLREQVRERAQRIGVRANRSEQEFIQMLSDWSGLLPDRVTQAMAPGKPSDGAVLVRIVADLQTLLKTLH